MNKKREREREEKDTEGEIVSEERAEIRLFDSLRRIKGYALVASRCSNLSKSRSWCAVILVRKDLVESLFEFGFIQCKVCCIFG